MEENLYKTSSEEVIDKKFRHFMFILYPEWENYDDILRDIKGNFKNWAYITHKPEESEKKEHTHLILSLENARTIESICSRLNIPSNLCQRVRGLRGACRYLIHIDNEEKIQYTLEDVIVSNSFKPTFFQSFDDLESESDMLDNIFAFIEDCSKSYKPIEIEVQLTKFVCSQSYNKVFKRYYSTFVKYINDCFQKNNSDIN